MIEMRSGMFNVTGLYCARQRHKNIVWSWEMDIKTVLLIVEFLKIFSYWVRETALYECISLWMDHGPVENLKTYGEAKIGPNGLEKGKNWGV